MGKFLGHRRAVGQHSANGFYTPGTTLWVVTFKPETMAPSPYEIYHGFARGPGGNFLVFIDDHGFGVAENGFINEYAPNGDGMYVMPGQTITCNWSINTGDPPDVTFYLKEAGPL